VGRSSFAAIALLAFSAIACGGSGAAPTTVPPAMRTTDTFSGSVPINGSVFHTFAVSQTGEVDVTLSAAAPSPTVVMGIGLGTIVESQCSLLPGASANVQPGASAQLSGIVTAGTLCAEIHDAGNQTAPVSYTLSVTHP
jgi:hypothetical protein